MAAGKRTKNKGNMFKTLETKLKIALLVVLDAVFINLAYILALLMRFDFSAGGAQFTAFLDVYLANWWAITIIQLLVFTFFGLYSSLWRYASTEELVKIAFSCLAANIVVLAFMGLIQQTLPRSIYPYAALLEMFLVGGVRFGYRIVRNLRTPGMFNLGRSRSMSEALQDTMGGDSSRRVMLVGAGDAGAAMIKEIRLQRDQARKIVVAVDDDRQKVGQRISGIKIAGTRNDIPKLARRYAVDEIIIAIPTATRRQIKEILDICHKTRCKVKITPALIDLVNEKVSVKSLRDVDIEDLLGRDPVQVDLKEISNYLEERIVLVTGAGGSIGSELCRQIGRFRPRRMVLLDIYENTVFELAADLRHRFPDIPIDIVIASIRDRDAMEETFAKFRPHVVFHAAAHKHVPLMEDSPKEAIENNVIGTKNVMEMAAKFVADRFVLISTDKAVNPTNVMGASKRMCEMLMQEMARESTKTIFSAVRFGNVLGSNGSVIPIFRRQIAEGGPVTVTHPEITRYFMTIPEAVQLVIQTGSMAKGGEIFILDMGEPVKILNLAENLIRLSGYEPYKDIEIEITGLRPGEKLYEELLLAEEGIRETGHNKIFIGHPIAISDGFRALLEGEGGVDACVDILKPMSNQEVKEWIRTMVPNYTPTSNR